MKVLELLDILNPDSIVSVTIADKSKALPLILNEPVRKAEQTFRKRIQDPERQEVSFLEANGLNKIHIVVYLLTKGA